MDFIFEDEELVVEVVKVIHAGDVPSLKRKLSENPGLATARNVAGDNNDQCNNLGVSRQGLNKINLTKNESSIHKHDTHKKGSMASTFLCLRNIGAIFLV
ncbi:hypothetical protein [Cytobacillus firmus]|uniref:hypothetical protein n=1 Tax=Cytobacillus firmus TaxID=1399 RepID=UPI00249454DB|nr:hypothetical protein [Cytobacillus firmus]